MTNKDVFREGPDFARTRGPGSKILNAFGAAAGALLVLMAIAQLVSLRQGLSLEVVPADHVSREYVEHLALALAHFVPGIAFTILGALQFSTRVRGRWPLYHRVAGVVFVLSTLAVGISGVWMNEILPGPGGILKYVGALVFGVVMIAAAALGMVAIARRDLPGHRAWMMRAYGIGLATGVQRLIALPLFLALGELEDLTIGMIMWLGWFLTLTVVEWRLRRPPGTRRDARGRGARVPAPIHGGLNPEVSA